MMIRQEKTYSKQANNAEDILITMIIRQEKVLKWMITARCNLVWAA